MCGIAGIISRLPIDERDIARVRSMSRALVHRGPDGSGEYISKHVALAARRLAIVGLENGDQPLRSEDGSLTLVVNGEIYNHRALRTKLERKGHRFRTQSDCETILCAYREYGTKLVDHLRGMFAFAIWDEPRQRLVLGRDPMGEKPLLIYQKDGLIVFASEMKALLRSGLVPFELDPQAINLYFHYQYVPEPLTAVRGVRKLEAAQLCVVDIAPWRIAETCFWRMQDAEPVDLPAAPALRDKLQQVSPLITSADVPVGVALSGGLDSSAIAALAARDLDRDVQAFSVGYTGRPAGIDERDDAKAFAAHLGIPCHEVEIDTADIVAFFPKLNFWRDEPIADYSGHGYYAVMRSAHEHGVRVMLQGQGGDELFWGYPALREAAKLSHSKAALHSGGAVGALKHLMAIRRNLPASATGRASIANLREGFRRFRDERAASRRLSFYDLLPDYAGAAKAGRCFYGPRFAQEIGAARADALFDIAPPWHCLDAILTNLVSATYLRSNGVAQGDRLSMASSVELRLPFLDRDFVDLVIGLRKAESDIDLPPKTWLREATGDLIPEWVLQRPKRGFEPPVAEWHRGLFAAYGRQLKSGYLAEAGVLDPRSLESFSAGERPPGQSSPLSFKALVLEQWCRTTQSEATGPDGG